MAVELHTTSYFVLHCISDVVPLSQGYFGQSTSRSIYLDNVVCNGDESSLLDCEHEPVGVHNCDHSEDAGVRCEGIQYCIYCVDFRVL